MAGERVERRLTAVLAADVAGYSRLTGIDEEGTHARLTDHLRTLVDPKIAEHRGRVVKNTGDGLLAEFSSVVDAVRCAVDIQRGMVERNTDVPQEKRIEFRVGINVGDIIIDRGDIFGDGVNVAARLEGIAEPGGICVSARVHEFVQGQLDITFTDAGEQQLKNIAQPVRVYGIKIVSRPQASDRSATPGRSIQAPRLSIVVLPFANLNRDPDQDYFVDGLTEDLTTELSRLAGSFVIAWNTAFSLKNQIVDVRQIGRELGVRYVLRGSVRKAGQRVRVAAQLIDSETGRHLWADRFDRDISDFFELQDAITIELARALEVQLVGAEGRRSERSSNPDALDLVMRARAYTYRGASRENFSAAVQLYQQAVQLAPDDVQALSGLADALATNFVSSWSEEREEDLRRAETLAARALTLDPHDALCHDVMGFVHRLQGRFDQAVNEGEAAIRLNPNLNSAHYNLGYAKIYMGRGEEALPHFADAIRLGPRDPFLFLGYFGIGYVRFLLGDDDRAIEELRKAIALSPTYPSIHLALAAAYGMQGRADEASAALAGYFRTGPTAGTIALVRARSPSTHPAFVAQRQRFYEGLRRAGMLEQ